MIDIVSYERQGGVPYPPPYQSIAKLFNILINYVILPHPQLQRAGNSHA